MFLVAEKAFDKGRWRPLVKKSGTTVTTDAAGSCEAPERGLPAMVPFFLWVLVAGEKLERPPPYSRLSGPLQFRLQAEPLSGTGPIVGATDSG